MINKWPSKKEIDRVLEKLEKADAARLLPQNADNVDRLKFKLCEIILIYKQEKGLSNDDMGVRLNVDGTEISKIVNYHIERYTIDKLYRLALKIAPDLSLDLAA